MSNKTTVKRQSSPRVEKKREQARLEILDVAEEILHSSGVDAVTLASVAGALSMTKQAIYHYFPSKEALVRSLITRLLDQEIETLIEAVNETESAEKMLGILIRAFHEHYIGRLEAFRTVYCQSQLYSAPEPVLDQDTLRKEINPRTRHLFDILENRLPNNSMDKKSRAHMRQLAFAAWTSALGLLTMLSVADATNDPLIHCDSDLLDVLSNVFDSAVIA